MWNLFDQRLVGAMEMASALPVFFFGDSFCGERKSRIPGQNPQNKVKINNKLSPHKEPGPSGTQATLVGGKHSHNCFIPAPQN